MARRPDPESRGKLLAAARAAFAEVGVDGARIGDLTRAAGLSKGAFYLHFESKEAAFEELVTDLFEAVARLSAARHAELLARCGGGCRPGPDELAELDHQHTVRLLDALWEHRDMLRCVLEQAAGPRAHLVDRLVDLSRATLVGQLEEIVASEGMRADLDRELVSDLLIGLYLQLGRRMIRSAERPDFDLWARTVNTLVAEGISVPRASVSPVSSAVAFDGKGAR